MTPINVFVCPACGVEIHANAVGCRACGARKENGEWLLPETYDGLGISEEDDFDYEEFVREEFGEGTPRRDPKKVFWTVVAIILVLAFLSLSLSGWW